MDFEIASIPLTNIDISNDATILGSFNGDYFGKIELTSSNSEWISSTVINEILPQLGAEVYLEVDIYNTEDVVTGLLATNSSGSFENPNIQINEQDPNEVVWRKIYIDLTTIISGSKEGSSFKHTFQAILDE